MTYKELLYLITIYDEGGFSAAAQKLYISQSALSQSIRKLENEFGVSFFIRHSTHSEPTKACSFFVEHGRELLSNWEQFTSEMHMYVQHQRAELTVGMPAFLCRNLLPFILPYFEQKHPEIKLNIVEDSSNNLEMMVKKDIINLCLVREPAYISTNTRIPVIPTELFLAVPKDHPFCKEHPYTDMQHLESVDLAELKDEPFSLLRHQRANHVWAPLFEEAGFTPNIYRRSGVWGNIKDYVKNGLSLGFVDELLARYEPDDDQIFYYRIPSKWLKRSVLAVYHPGKMLSREESYFIEAVKEYPQLVK